jgi:hypothetical protein
VDDERIAQLEQRIERLEEAMAAIFESIFVGAGERIGWWRA